MSNTDEMKECRGCGEEINSEEAAHDAINEALNSLVTLGDLSPLSAQHVLQLGLVYFVDQVYHCAPNREEAERMITDTINKIREEHNHG